MAPTSSQHLATLTTEYWETLMHNAPEWATYLGDPRYNDRLSDLGPEQRAREHGQMAAFLARLNAIGSTGLFEEELVTADCLRFQLELALEGEQHKFHQWSVDQMEGPQVSFPMLLNFHPFKTPKDYEDMLTRFRAFPRVIDQYLDNLREGVKENRTAVRVATERVIDQLKAMLKTPIEQSPFYQPLDKMPASIGGDGRETIRREWTGAIGKSIYSALQKMCDFLEKDYLRHARGENVGLWALPGGEAAYRYRIRLHTTLDISAEGLHRIGREELASIEKEMDEIARRQGHRGDLKSFMAKLHADKNQFYATREDLLNGFRDILKKADLKLPQYFGRLPKTGYEVKSIEEYREKDSPAAFYNGPPDDGSRKGIFYANTYQPETRPKYNMTALAVHEAVPGHHFQIAVATENRDLPAFRRHTGSTSLIEGWALYTERLAEEMDLYEDDLSRFGMLTYQSWRACRLIVDTGIHAMKWTRQQTIDFMTDHLAIPGNEVLNEIDRYIIWPGQALAYKMGQREIMALRLWSQRELGPHFDLRAFHDELLRPGAVPLPVLRNLIQRWARHRM